MTKHEASAQWLIDQLVSDVAARRTEERMKHECALMQLVRDLALDVVREASRADIAEGRAAGMAEASERTTFTVRYRVRMTLAQQSAFEVYVLDRADDSDPAEQQREARIMSLGYHIDRSCTGENIDEAIAMVCDACESASEDKDAKAYRLLDALSTKLIKARRKIQGVTR